MLKVEKTPFEHVYTTEYFGRLVQPVQRLSRFILLRFKRYNGVYEFANLRMSYWAFFLCIIDLIGSVIKITLAIKQGNLDQAQKVTAIGSIEFYMIVCGLSVTWNQLGIAKLANDFDRLLPNDLAHQKRMRVRHYADMSDKRYIYLYNLVTLVLIVFFITPIGTYFLFDDGVSAISDDYHLLPSWLPFGIKENRNIYLYFYIFEMYHAMSGTSLLITYEKVFAFFMIQFEMHFNYLTYELRQLDANCTQDPQQAEGFYRHLRQCIVYEQRLRGMMRHFNAMFCMPTYFNSLLSASSICFHFYLIANATTMFDSAQFLGPCLVLIWLNYDIGEGGTRIEGMSLEVNEIFYNLNWYDGSIKYRKLMVMWLQCLVKPCQFSAREFVVINREHFKAMMMLAYQMFTFLQSNKK